MPKEFSLAISLAQPSPCTCSDLPLIQTQEEVISDRFFLSQLYGEVGEEVSREREEVVIIEVEEFSAKRP